MVLAPSEVQIGQAVKQGGAMKQKQQHSLAVFFTINLTLAANALFAQNLPGPSVPKPQREMPQPTQPATPVQPAPGLPGPDPLPGQRGTIPEQMQSPDTRSQQEMVISSDDIRRAQEALKAKGRDPGAISGKMHAKTQEALREFQKANDLPATGILDHKTAEKLGIKLKGSTVQQRQESTKPKAPSNLQLR
jgi:Putative peptidoglycan binding domain